MSSGRKIPPNVHNSQRNPAMPPNRPQSQRQGVVQPKAAVPQSSKRETPPRPTPPPVYRPEHRKVVQPKIAPCAPTRKPATPPPVCRPHTTHGLLQPEKDKSVAERPSPRALACKPAAQKPAPVAQPKAANHSKGTVGKSSPTLYVASRGPNVVQRATVSLVGSAPMRGFQSNATSGRVIQRATVHAHVGYVAAATFTELTNMMAAIGGGAATGGGEVALAALIAGAAAVLPANNQDTVALGDDGLGNGAASLLAVGSAAFQAATGAGQRVARGPFHGEMAAVHHGFDDAVAASQDCCIFCYGYMAFHGVDHQALRANPWPNTQWTHPTMGFRLSSGAQFLAVGNAVRINHAGVDHYWQGH